MTFRVSALLCAILFGLCCSISVSAQGEKDGAKPPEASPPLVAPKAIEPATDKKVPAAPEKTADVENRLVIELTGSDAVDAEYEIFREKGGKIVGIFPSPLRMAFPAAKLTLLADAAVVWVTPREHPRDGAEGALDVGAQFLSNVGAVEVYAEGNIWLGYGKDTAIRAERMYMDLAQGELKTFTLRGVVDSPRAKTTLDNAQSASEASKTTTTSEKKADDGTHSLAIEHGNQVFMRAEKLRILELSADLGGRKTLELENGMVTGSSLATPDWAIGAANIAIHISHERRELVLNHPTLHIAGSTVLTLPYDSYAYDLDSEFPRSRLSLSRSAAFGTTIRAKADVITAYDFLVDPAPPFRPCKFSPIVDYFSERGLATGGEVEYGRIKPFDTGMSGWLQGYGLNDRGDHRDIAQELGFFPLRSNERGRVKGYGRMCFSDDLQIDANINYTTDEHFLEEFFRPESLRNNNEHTFVVVRKDFRTRTYFMELRTRVRPYQNDVDRLPLIGFGVWREPVGPAAAGLLLTGESQLGVFRLRRANDDEFDHYQFLRGDALAHVNRPFDFGVLTVDPGIGGRATVSDKRVTGINPPFDPFADFSPPPGGVDAVGDDAAWRFQSVATLDVQTHFVGTFPNFTSGCFNMTGLRHVMTPKIAWKDIFAQSSEADMFFQIDETAAARLTNVAVLSFRNRFQTRRPDASGQYNTVDALDFLLEAPMYPNEERDNGGERFGDIEMRLGLRPRSNLHVSTSGFFASRDLDWRRINGSATVAFEDADFGGYYRALRGEHGVLGLRAKSLLGRSYAVEARQEYDVRLRRVRDTVVQLSRIVLRPASLNIIIRRDAITRDFSFGLSFSAIFQSGSSQ